jgi:hypothetical protein
MQPTRAAASEDTADLESWASTNDGDPRARDSGSDLVSEASTRREDLDVAQATIAPEKSSVARARIKQEVLGTGSEE